MKPAIAFIHKVNQVIINPIILLLFAVAVLVFLYGVFIYVKDSGSEDARATGKQHIIWGIFGMFIMISVFGILTLVMNTIGVSPTETGIGQVIPR